MPKPLPPAEYLHKLLSYDPETGQLFWKRRSVDLFTTTHGKKIRTAEHTCKQWNNRYAGKQAFTVKAPAPSCFHLFRGSQAIDLAQKPMSEVRGPRFSGLGGVWDALRLEAVDHFAKLQSLQSPAAKSA
jgi:hypothetical protein